MCMPANEGREIVGMVVALNTERNEYVSKPEPAKIDANRTTGNVNNAATFGSLQAAQRAIRQPGLTLVKVLAIT